MPMRTSSWPSAASDVANRERGAHGSLGVVLVCDRRAEDGHDRVADELLDGASEALELGADATRGTAVGSRRTSSGSSCSAVR